VASEQATALKRYDLRTFYRCGESGDELVPNVDGGWVRYDDIASALDAARAEVWNQAADECNGMARQPHAAGISGTVAAQMLASRFRERALKGQGGSR
jgi:hypothetical protein